MNFNFGTPSEMIVIFLLLDGLLMLGILKLIFGLAFGDLTHVRLGKCFCLFYIFAKHINFVIKWSPSWLLSSPQYLFRFPSICPYILSPASEFYNVLAMMFGLDEFLDCQVFYGDHDCCCVLCLQSSEEPAPSSSSS